MPAITPYTDKKGNSFYMLQAYLGTDPKTGKRVRVSRRGFKTEKEALLEYSRLLIEQNATGLKRAVSMRYKEIYDLWLDPYKETVKESTLVKTVELFRLHILPVLGNSFVDKITLQDAQRAVKAWHEKLVNYRAVANYASMVMKEAQRIGAIDKNPFDLVVMPKTKKKEEKELENFYNREELQAFLEAVKGEGDKWYTFFRLLAFTGMRRGEALALTWKDINFKGNKITINKTLTRGKNGAYIVLDPKTAAGKRSISIDGSTADILKAWKAKQREEDYMLGLSSFKPDKLVFHNEKDSFVSFSRAGLIINRVCEKIGLQRITVHGFRHTHCSLLFEAGLGIKEVQDRLGHSDIKTTMNIYAHVTAKKRDEIAEKFAKFVNF